MKVFISWSGEISRKIAEVLQEWLPNVIQAVVPFMSTEIAKGERWSSTLAYELQSARFAIICLTPDNIDAPWILFEAGALSKNLENTLVCPYLFGFSAAELTGPLVQFQTAVATRADTLKLVHSVNRSMGDSAVKPEIVERAFGVWWPELERKLASIEKAASSDSRAAPVITDKPGNSVLHELAQLSNSEIDRLQQIIRALVAPVLPDQAEVTPRDEYVFLVHGRNHAIREKVARFIERLGVPVLILDEQPSMGRTIIENLEHHAEAGYAVVLLTGDDRGGLLDASAGAQTLRPRQNVLLELGYFLGVLGRERISVLVERGVELPSDLSGILFIQLDDRDSWKWELARELKTAGLRINLDAVL